jgi:hypothetical protein
MPVLPLSMGVAQLKLASPSPFFFRMYLLILYFETINKLKLFFECGIPMPQDVFAFATAKAY